MAELERAAVSTDGSALRATEGAASGEGLKSDERDRKQPKDWPEKDWHWFA